MYERSRRMGEEMMRLLEEYGAIPKGENEVKVDDEPRMIAKEDVKNVFDAARRKFIIEYKEKVESDHENKERHKALLKYKLSDIDALQEDSKTCLKNKIVSHFKAFWLSLSADSKTAWVVALLLIVFSLVVSIPQTSSCFSHPCKTQ